MRPRRYTKKEALRIAREIELFLNFMRQISPQARRKVYHLSTEFLVEAAVLVFVFPVLDVIIQYGRKAVTPGLVSWSLTISGVLFILGLILAVLGAMKEEREEEEEI